MDEGTDAGRRIELRSAGMTEAAELQEVFEAAADYFRRLTGKPGPDPDAGIREVRAASEAEGREVALVREVGTGRAVGAVGWWAGSPEPDSALLGMLLIEEPSRGRGLAREALELLEDRLRESGVVRVRTAVSADHVAAHAVLEALGFESMDRRTHVDMDGGRLRIAFYEKEL